MSRDRMENPMNKAVCPKMEQNVFIAPGALVIGDVTLGEESSVWYHSTLRGDDAPITVGRRTNIQDNTMLHVDKDIPLVIGEGCSIGHGAILHGCRIGDNTLVGMGAVILNRAKIGRNCIIGAGTLVTQGKEIPDNSLVLGSPGKVVRNLTQEEIEENQHNAQVYVRESREHNQGEYVCITGQNVS